MSAGVSAGASSETAWAKINLALHVRERMGDGYHRIETLFAFCNDGDRLEATPGETLTLEVAGPFAGALGSGEDNLVLRAARALADAAGVRPRAALRLDKRLPVASGIGGGSADAAAALRLLTRLWDVDVASDRMEMLAAALGADVPACLRSTTAWGDDRGDRLRPGPGFAGRPVLLVNPGVPLGTAEVFAGWDCRDRGALTEDPWSWRNDLEAPATALRPVIADVLATLRDTGPTFARMSGSGATCFALFADAAARDVADAAIAAARPAWWRLVASLR